jgi:translation initiation factor 3 subunit I
MTARTVQSRYMVTGGADNEIRLWEVGYCRCVQTWQFQTPVKWVAFDIQGERVVCITEDRMGRPGAVQVLAINRQDGKRASIS